MSKDTQRKSEIVLYQTEDGISQIQLRAAGGTVWLTQREMAELFDATKQNISLHLKNIFEEGDLSEDSVVKESLTTAADGKKYVTKFYNLDAILAVGYRVRSLRGTLARKMMRRCLPWNVNSKNAKLSGRSPLPEKYF